MFVTLLELKTRVRELTNTDTSAPTQHHITDDFLRRCINRWRMCFYDRLIEKLPKDFAKAADIATVVGRSVYEEAHGFPGDFYVMIGLFANTAGMDWRQVPQFQHIQDYAALMQLSDTGGGSGWPVAHQVQAGRRALEVLPAATHAGDTLRLIYAPKLPELVADDDPMDGVNGWEDLVVYKTCMDVAIRRKRPEDVPLYANRASEIEAYVDQISLQRSLAEPQMIQDVRGDLDDMTPYTWGVHVP